MTKEEFMGSGVMIYAIPEKEDKIEVGRFSGMLQPTGFWMRTSGMGEVFGKPEFEFRDVPPLMIRPMLHELNTWAMYAVDTTKSFADGQIVQMEGAPGVYKLVEVTDNEFWGGCKAFRFELVAVDFLCHDCENCSCTDEEDPEEGA